mmetsp:Transcript_38144/g.59492  ORF Transcript_38144/g.59492 Transcript_38144/m.59492 type:complete len:135 (+) Transcript_38144:532-936(+)
MLRIEISRQIPVSEDQYQTHQEDRRQAPVESGDSERARGHHWLPTHLAHRSEFTIHDADLAEDIPGTMDPYSLQAGMSSRGITPKQHKCGKNCLKWDGEAFTGMFYNKIVETMQQGHAKDDGVDDKFSKLLLPF